MTTINKIRYILNILFLVGVVITIVLYATSDNSEPFFYAGCISCAIKLLELILRFVY